MVDGVCVQMFGKSQGCILSAESRDQTSTLVFFKPSKVPFEWLDKTMSVESQRYMVVTLAWLGCMVKIMKSVKSRNATFPPMIDDGQTHWQKKQKKNEMIFQSVSDCKQSF